MRYTITEADYVKANNRAARDEEINSYGKQIIFRTKIKQSKKIYSRKRFRLEFTQ